MGVASLPRLYCNGFTYWNPSTFNNNDALPTYDSPNARLNWPYLNERGIYSAEAFRQYAINPSVAPGEILPAAEWNYYGGNQCGFVAGKEPVIERPDLFSKPSGDTCITGYTNAVGEYVAGGDWLGQLIRFNVGDVPSKLVDVDPICFWSSQYFSDKLVLGDPSTGLGLEGPTTSRAYSRWMNVCRNFNLNKQLLIAGGASCVWQTCLRKEDIQFFQKNAPPGSITAALQSALGQPGTSGLMLRFVTYMTLYFNGEVFADCPPGDVNSRMIVMSRLYKQYEDALAAYRAGQTTDKPKPPMNRAYSKTVGWLGPWREGELMTMPGGRLLGASYLVQKAGQTILGLRTAYPRGVSSANPLGPAAVEVSVNPSTPDTVERVTLDFGSTIPELDNSGAKADLGTLQLGIVPVGDTSAQPTVVANISVEQYAQGSYEKTAGVIDIPASAFASPVSASQLANAQFVLTVESFPPSPDANAPATSQRTLGLSEYSLWAETDQRGVYLEEPAPNQVGQPQKTMDIQVRYLGGKPPAGTTLCIGQYAPDPPNLGEGGWLAVSERDPKQQSPIIQLVTKTLQTGDGYVVVEVPYENDGKPYATVSIALAPLMPGFPNLAFFPFPPGQTAEKPPLKVAAPFIANVFYGCVRVQPFHNLMARQFEEWLKTNPLVDEVNQRVFNEVFGTYYMLHPVMDFIRDAMKFQAFRGLIMETTDPALFDSSKYMPVSRALSAGQRRILELWSNYLDGPQIPRAPKAMRVR